MDNKMEGTWQAKFDEFDRKNPHIWQQYRSLANEYIGANNFLISSKDIISVIRWHTDLQTGNDGKKEQAKRFKVNDAFTSRYARKFITEYPQHKDRFGFRRLRSI